MTIEWYYMWSQKYRFFHEFIMDTVKEPEIHLKPIFIDQAVFDTQLYIKEGEHSWSGCTIKVDLLIERLKSSKGPYILFTDVDLIIKSNIYDVLKVHMSQEDTMVFLKEGEQVNIGFILLKVCKEVIEFWELVKSRMVENGGHDQTHVNTLLKEYSMKWATFDHEKCTLSNMWNGSEFVIMQPLSSCLGKELDFAEKIFCAAQHMNAEAYMKYVPDSIIPYIYQIQELIFLSHQESNRKD